jgi:FkbH-like protein
VPAPAVDEGEGLRAAVDAAIAEQDWSTALTSLGQLFDTAPWLSNARFVTDRMARVPAAQPRTRCRVAFLRSFTVEPVLPLLGAAAMLRGVEVTAHVGDFNTYAQDLLVPGGALDRFEPDVVVLAVQTRDLLPELWNSGGTLAPADAAQAVSRTLDDLRAWLTAFRARSAAHVVVHNFELPAEPDAGILDAQSPDGQSHAIQDLNRRLAGLAADLTGVSVLDYDGLVARVGRSRWHDERKWLTARMPIAAAGLWPMAAEYLRFVVALRGRLAKALVCDLDNTLWGGVLGEDGLEGLKLDGEYPGAAYLALQRAILALHARGVILALASKNDRADALDAIARHPGMLLRPEHFSAVRIGWNDKAQSLREIAAELNIGVDALAFLDDNPAERSLVRRELPEVTVIELPADPMEYARTLRAYPVFERVTVSREDRARGRMYAEERERTELRSSATSVEDFYRSLRMEVDMRPATPASVARVAQLTQKTNQFNVTTRRYSDAEVAAMLADPAAGVWQLSVRDRFGDSGLVGVAITRDAGGGCEIDTLLMSCRVIGRTVETAMVAWLAEEARRRGARSLRGWFLPTKKNEPASRFYPDHGFVERDRRDDGVLWELDLAAGGPECPEWITRAGAATGAREETE